MVNALKRMTYAEEAGFKKRAAYYFWLRASQVIAMETPDATELLFAKGVYSGKIDKKDMCLTVITNTSIGTAIDSSTEPTDSDLEWAVITDNQFGKLAVAYDAAGRL
jgi:hypothetical protein